MDSKTKKQLERHVDRLLEENPPMFGEGLYEPGSFQLLKLRLAYQRWLLMKIAPLFPSVPMVDVVAEVIAPRVH